MISRLMTGPLSLAVIPIPRMSKGVAFGADSGTVALALATGEATMPVPESVKVVFKVK